MHPPLRLPACRRLGIGAADDRNARAAPPDDNPRTESEGWSPGLGATEPMEPCSLNRLCEGGGGGRREYLDRRRGVGPIVSHADEHAGPARWLRHPARVLVAVLGDDEPAEHEKGGRHEGDPGPAAGRALVHKRYNIARSASVPFRLDTLSRVDLHS